MMQEFNDGADDPRATMGSVIRDMLGDAASERYDEAVEFSRYKKKVNDVMLQMSEAIIEAVDQNYEVLEQATAALDRKNVSEEERLQYLLTLRAFVLDQPVGAVDATFNKRFPLSQRELYKMEGFQELHTSAEDMDVALKFSGLDDDGSNEPFKVTVDVTKSYEQGRDEQPQFYPEREEERPAFNPFPKDEPKALPPGPPQPAKRPKQGNHFKF